jgi:hypothetical protein
VLSEARKEIAALKIEDERRREEAERHAKLVKAIDGLLFQLEDLNLTGVDRVPAVLRDRASTILDRLPPAEVEADQDALRLRFRVVPLMDVLFRAQEVLFRLRDPARELDEDELGA